jgi:hypothetical protein
MTDVRGRVVAAGCYGGELSRLCDTRRSGRLREKGGATMCNVFAGQDSAGYALINRSVRIAGHSTSIQLEAAFWTLLDEIAQGAGPVHA